MKIKDLRSYRSFYKETRHVTDVYDENFIGNFTTDVNGNINKRGWFSLYHGDKDGIGKAKEGIGNFLKTFLNMAKDGQAVYEFLQNAVDAGSTHLTIGWGSDSESGDDYLLVANNGEMFSPEQIRSILNAGSSTKSGSDIGKFGIGFKLAHRLVGKDNGLDELLDNQQPSGPILFSWGNGEIDRLLKSPDLEPVDTDWKNRKLTTHVPGEEPWLFKMLLTCFPCMPENDFINEKIRMVDGETLSSNAFSRREYLALTRWAKRYEDTLSSADYSHGALFFITLGRGKIAELENKNLAEGIAHSIAILNEIVSKKNNSDRGLETVRINNDIITQPNLLFHHLRVRKDVERDVFAHIIFGVNTASELSTKELNQLDEHNDIEFIFGFRPHDEIGNTFRGAPNLYLFFPLSEEVHNFNYILHSNAFDKATSRTFLQAGAIGQDTINSRLLHSLAARMENELDVLYRSQISTNNLSQFLSLYAALISSSSSISEERQWIVKPYLERMNKSLKNVIPVKGVSGELPVMLSTDPSNVRIRRTSVEFDIESVSDIQFRWFYWDYGDDQRILQGAVEKLGIRFFDIVSILNLPEGAQLINEWILAEPSRVKDVFAELRSIPPEGQISGTVKKNLSALKLFRFKNGKHLCDAELIELQDDGYIVLWKGLGDIGHLLEKAGISTTIDDLDEIGSFDSWFNHFASDSQLKNNEYIIHIFNSCIVSATRELYSQKQKLEVFRGIRKLQTEATIERMRKLILFSNKTSSLVPLGNILKENTVDWLNGFVLTADEYHSDLNNYLISNDEDIYTNIIFPLWEDVLAVLVKLDYGSIVKALEDIVSYYEISTDLTKVQKQLGSMPFIPFESQVLKSDQIYVNEKLQDGISATRYEQIQAVCAEKLGLHIPDAAFLPSYTLPPFSRNDSARDIRFKSMDLTLSEADTILHFCSVCDIPILSEMVLVCGESQQYSLHPMELKRSFYTPNTILQKYIEEHLPDELIRLPDELEKFKKMVPLRGESLNEFLISKLEYSDTGDRISLTEALINEGEATVASLSELFEQYRIDMDNRENRENAILAKLLKRLIHIDTVDIDEIRSKIVLFDSKDEIQFDSLGEVNDKIWLDLGDSGIFLSRANLLGLDNTEIQTAQSFVDHLVKGDLFSRKEAELLFKMDIAGFSDDLVNEFLSNLENHHLTNPDQLAFVILANSLGKTFVKAFRVESLDGAWYPLTGNWLFHETPGHAYYDATYVLSKRYDNLRELLAVLGRDYFPLPGGSKDSQENESILYNDFRFALGFYPAVFKGMETEDANFLSYLFELWKSTPRIQLTKLPSDDWEPVLGFDIQKKINGDLVVEEELYPDVVRSWIEEQPLEREQFLTFLGQSELSKNIQNLRHFLQFENSDDPDIDLEAIGSAHLKNTIIGLEKGFIHSKAKVTEIKANSEKHEVVKQIYDLVLPASDAGELPFPVLHSNNNLSFSSWTEQDLFTINTADWDVLVRQLNLDKISEALNNAPFVYPDDLYMDHLEGLVDILPVQYVYLMQDCVPLDTLSYYQDWSIQNGIRIFRTPALHHEVSLQYNSQKYLIGKIDRNEYVKVNGAEFTSIYYKDKHSLKGLVQLLRENDDDLATAIMELAGIRETLSLVSSQSLLKDDPENQSVDENSALLKEEYNRQHQQAYREEILARLEGEEKYTYEWVESFIQFLATYDEGSGSDRRRIGFQRVKPFVKENAENTRFFLLEGANSGLAPNIEDQSEYELELISGQGERKNIAVSAVIREGQDLRIIFTSELSQAQNKTLLNAKSIKLAYTPVLNLYRRLQAAFRNKEIIPPWEDFLEAIPPLSFIYGPPGTGKTTLLASQINELHEQNPLVKILVLVPTNKAGDVIARKVIENNENIAVQRLSVATDPHLEALDSAVYNNGLTYDEFDGINVLITTIHRLPYTTMWDDESQEKRLLYGKGVKWDKVILDESSMIGLPYFVFAAIALSSQGSIPEFTISGDPKQIPPVLNVKDSDLERISQDDENVYTMFSVSEFKSSETLRPDLDKFMFLDKQYRSVPAIGNLFSNFSYAGKLHHHRENRRAEDSPLFSKLPESLCQSISMIDVPLDPDIGLIKPAKLNKSSYHLYSAVLVSDLVANISSFLKPGTPFSIGVVSPYRVQAALVNRLVKSRELVAGLSVYCDTVHGFQGDECNLMIFIVNPNNIRFTGHPWSLLSKEYVYNVAISRARDHLWILHPYSSIPDNLFINKLSEIAEDASDGSLSEISSSEVEKYLYGETSHLIENCEIAEHDDINIDREHTAKYMIRAGMNAIDVMIRDVS